MSDSRIELIPLDLLPNPNKPLDGRPRSNPGKTNVDAVPDVTQTLRSSGLDGSPAGDLMKENELQFYCDNWPPRHLAAARDKRIPINYVFSVVELEAFEGRICRMISEFDNNLPVIFPGKTQRQACMVIVHTCLALHVDGTNLTERTYLRSERYVDLCAVKMLSVFFDELVSIRLMGYYMRQRADEIRGALCYVLAAERTPGLATNQWAINAARSLRAQSSAIALDKKPQFNFVGAEACQV